MTARPERRERLISGLRVAGVRYNSRMGRWKALTFIAAMAMVGCDDVDEPIYDGYRLEGAVVDSTSGAPIESVGIFGFDQVSDSVYYFPSAVTAEDGAYRLDFFPATGPSQEMLRFAKPGYRPKDLSVSAMAVKEERFRYRLDVALAPQTELDKRR